MKWTDKKVKEFCRIYTAGAYHHDYKDCRTIDEKIKRFKIINKEDWLDKSCQHLQLHAEELIKKGEIK